MTTIKEAALEGLHHLHTIHAELEVDLEEAVEAIAMIDTTTTIHGMLTTTTDESALTAPMTDVEALTTIETIEEEEKMVAVVMAAEMADVMVVEMVVVMTSVLEGEATAALTETLVETKIARSPDVESALALC